MKDQLKIVVVFVLAFAIPLSMICCCLHNSFVKNLQPAGGHCPFHPERSAQKQKEPVNSKDCLCLKILNTGDKPYIFTQSFLNFHQRKSPDISMEVPISLQNIISFPFSIIQNRPPPLIATADQPVYLKLAVLRI